MSNFLSYLKELFVPNENKDLDKIVKDCEARIFGAYVGNRQIKPEEIAVTVVAVKTQVTKRLEELHKQQKIYLNELSDAVDYLKQK